MILLHLQKRRNSLLSKKPRISFQEIANAGSTIMAVNIGVIKSDNEALQTKFIGLDGQPSVETLILELYLKLKILQLQV